VSDLSFFTHQVDGREYAGWYRVLEGDRVEVFTRGRVEIIPCVNCDPEKTVKRFLEARIRALSTTLTANSSLQPSSAIKLEAGAL
jgi:hypothetical protein